jgi:hypothetical protein
MLDVICGLNYHSDGVRKGARKLQALYLLAEGWVNSTLIRLLKRLFTGYMSVWSTLDENKLKIHSIQWEKMSRS